MGAVKFIAFYLLCGLLASFAQIATSPLSVIPTLGASGAIAGVLGGYLILFPARRVRVLVGWVGLVELPAIIVIGFWGFLQFVNGFGSLASSGEQGGVAYWAHIGGFVAGLLLVRRFRDPQRDRQRGGYNSR